MHNLPILALSQYSRKLTSRRFKVPVHPFYYLFICNSNLANFGAVCLELLIVFVCKVLPSVMNISNLTFSSAGHAWETSSMSVRSVFTLCGSQVLLSHETVVHVKNSEYGLKEE